MERWRYGEGAFEDEMASPSLRESRCGQVGMRTAIGYLRSSQLPAVLWVPITIDGEGIDRQVGTCTVLGCFL